jgi:sugar phosphate isomerase/epimerase
MRISVFTVCMPEYTPEYAPEEAVKQLAAWGFDGVEWRVTTPPAPGEPVVNFWKGNRCTLAPETRPALRAAGYDGWISVEDFRTGAPTAQKLPDDLAYLRATAV